MNTISHFPIETLARAQKGIGWMVFHKTESIARRIKFLTRVLLRQESGSGYRLVRKRTVNRCMSTMDQKWSLLASQVRELRQNPQALEIAINIFISLVISRGMYEVGYFDTYKSEIMNSPASSNEISIILQFLRWFWLTESEVIDAISGHVGRQIREYEDDVYTFLRHIQLSKK